MTRLSVAALLGAAALIAAGCGVSPKKIENAEQRMATLVEKGVPDSLLSKPRVFVYQAKEESKKGNGGIAKKAADSLFIYLERVEKKYSDDLSRLKPALEAQRADIAKQAAGLTGLHKKCLDSLLVPADSLIALGYYVQAELKLKPVAAYVPKLIAEQDLSKTIKAKAPGTWKFTDKIKHSEDKTVNALEEKIFVFNSNGKAVYTHQKKGKSGPFVKEDFKFDSYGTWDVKGDTIHVLVDRFKITRQDFWDLKKSADGKGTEWILNRQPTYDSTITDGSQNRYIIWDDLLVDFKKGK